MHFLIVSFLLIALGLYTAGSWSLWRRKPGVLIDFLLGLILDAATVIIMFLGKIPAPTEPRGPMFYLHIILAMLGTIGFLGVMIYVAKNGDRKTYPRLGRFTMFVIWPTWVIGTILGFIHTLG